MGPLPLPKLHGLQCNLYNDPITLHTFGTFHIFRQMLSNIYHQQGYKLRNKKIYKTLSLTRQFSFLFSLSASNTPTNYSLPFTQYFSSSPPPPNTQGISNTFISYIWNWIILRIFFPYTSHLSITLSLFITSHPS